MTPQFIITLKILFIIACMVFIAAPSRADSIYIGQISEHFGKAEGIKRERHPLIIYEYEKYDHNWIMGWWKNSYDKHTIAFGMKITESKSKWGEVGYKAGIATGYRAPVFAAIYYQTDWIDINFLPGEMISAGVRYRF